MADKVNYSNLNRNQKNKEEQAPSVPDFVVAKLHPKLVEEMMNRIENLSGHESEHRLMAYLSGLRFSTYTMKNGENKGELCLVDAVKAREAMNKMQDEQTQKMRRGY